MTSKTRDSGSEQPKNPCSTGRNPRPRSTRGRGHYCTPWASEDLIPQKVRESIASWSDLIDYWSVDFDFSDEVFHNQWQAYRTRENPALATQSDWHEYPKPGTYSMVVKIIDIFGNDTTKLAEVRIK